MSITTVTVWVCSKCGAVERLDGGSTGIGWSFYCQGSPSGQHVTKPVLVMVPWA